MKYFNKLHIVILAVLSCAVVTACGIDSDSTVPNAQLVSEPSNRQVILQGQSNFRDVGGYVTADGRSVKWGEVYRSGRLSHLTDNDVARLDTIGIKTVVNFLTTEEIDSDGPDVLPPGVKEIPVPMEAGNMADLTAVVNAARRTGDFSSISPEINPEIHRRLIIEGREHYANLLRELANPENRPLVFHCSGGIHRTGTASAILLAALGVPWETIQKDYLLSNTYRQDEVQSRLAQLKFLHAENKQTKIEDVDTTNMEAFYILEASYIDAALQQAIADYGSIDAYIREGLGMTEKDIENLRSELLEK